MMKAYNTHQIFYAKNFYAHSGDIIADMRKVCQLDNPDWNFSTPKQILKFMSKQYLIWLNNTPEVEKEEHPKVAWENNPIAAEMWGILIAYGTYVPMTHNHGYIEGLPRYDVLKPQYGATFEYGTHDYPFHKSMTTDQLLKAADKILNISNVELIDLLADWACQRYDFKNSAKLLAEFGENVTPEELDEELWDGYSNLVGQNLDDDGNLPERYYHTNTKHFSIEIRPIFKPSMSFDFEVNLIPFRFEYTSDNICTIDNILDERVKCLNEVIKQYEISGAAKKIAEIATKLYENDSNIWDTPKNLVGDEYEMIEEIKSCVDIDPKNWDYYQITPEKEWEYFEKATDEYYPSSRSSGCFRTNIYNVNGKMKLAVVFETMFGCGCDEHKLWNNQGFFINSPMY